MSESKDTTTSVNQDLDAANDGSVKADYDFLGDSIFHGHKDLLKYYFQKYGADTCAVMKYKKNDLLIGFEGIKYAGSLKKDKIKDSIFVLNPLTICDLTDGRDGQAYYFTDTSLPRLETDSYCCHPENLFLTGDIDEDGISEIGQYFSSCSGRYKSLHVYSLKNNRWKEIGHCVFDLKFSGDQTDYKQYVRKIGKNKFEMLEITDLANDKTKIGKRNWLKFTM